MRRHTQDARPVEPRTTNRHLSLGESERVKQNNGIGLNDYQQRSRRRAREREEARGPRGLPFVLPEKTC